MRQGRLYVKILFSFLAVLFTTLIVVFALFVALPGDHFSTRFEKFTRTKALAIKKAVEDKIRLEPAADLSQNNPLNDFLHDLGRIAGAKVWLQKQDGTVPLKSFSGDIPKRVSRLLRKQAVTYSDITIYLGRNQDFYAFMPINFPGGQNGYVHVFFDRKEGPPPPIRGFAIGLLVIGLMAALLTIPVSRIITARLKKLRQSALTISEGNLSHRVNIKGTDEIGELARAFNRMAEKLETMILNARELTANVSHELRTPLTRIRIAQEILREKLEKGDVAQYEKHLDGINEDIQELDRLIGRILELSRLDRQESPLTFAPLDIVDLMEELLRRFQPMIQVKDLSVVSGLTAPPSFSGDKDALTTALLNILDNAAKFAPHKGQIRIQMVPTPGFLKISVTNTYEKLSEEELSAIFDPFHRAKHTKAAGSGLGLAIAKKIIERHGGGIGAYNTENGLEISISLPWAGPERPPA
jgi:signal transduction histidine kinase